MKRKKPAKQTVTARDWAIFGLPEPYTEVRFHDKRLWKIDFVFVRVRREHNEYLAVEVHGGTWSGGGHSRGAQQARDFEKGQHLALRSFFRMEFTPKQVKTGYAQAVVRAWIDDNPDRELPPDPEYRKRIKRVKVQP